MKTLITNAWILTMNEQMEEYRHGYVLAEEQILAIGPMEDLPADVAYDRHLDARGAILMPGMVNTHTHIGMIPFRSLGDDCPDRLRRFLFPLENECMDSALAAASGKYAIAEMQLAGVTAFFDMYYFEEALAQAAEEMNARALLAETVIDSVTVDVPEPLGGLAYAERFMPKWDKHGRIRATVAPHAPYTNTVESLQRADRLSADHGVPWTMHVSEMDFEVEQFRQQHGQTPVEFLEAIGSLEIGKQADLVLIETESVNMFPIFDPYSALVYSANAGNVRDVFIGGQQVVADKKPVGRDIPALREDLAAAMRESGFERKAMAAMPEK
ncbi:amidohydrolase family protein [Sporosarcina koreensis]|uniref:amidohydrolase family protein n=1 Tax=Sporosarcina koreensis TaxID=334735 RepID=UPI00058DEE77|nr:amidohydrolase family protein [Sporosarcina koreensis]